MRHPCDGAAVHGTAPSNRPGGAGVRGQGPPAWERCLACAHLIGAHGQPRGLCRMRPCDCGRFVWADEGPRVASFRLCLRWLWRGEMTGPSGRPTADWVGTMAALQALARLLGSARAERIAAEEAECWWAQTGSSPHPVALEAVRRQVPA